MTNLGIRCKKKDTQKLEDCFIIGFLIKDVIINCILMLSDGLFSRKLTKKWFN